jgi:hypothetical protein
VKLAAIVAVMRLTRSVTAVTAVATGSGIRRSNEKLPTTGNERTRQAIQNEVAGTVTEYVIGY